MQPHVNPARFSVWAALALVALTLAGTLLATRVAVTMLPPLLTQALRFLIGGAILMFVLLMRDASIFRTLGRRSIAAVAILAFLQIFCGQGALSAAEQSVGAGRAGLIMAGIPLWIAIFQAWFFRRPPSRKTVAGVAIGFVGLIPIVFKGSTSGTLLGTLLLLLSGASWAMGTILWARLRTGESLLAMTAMQLLVGGGMLLAASALFGELRHPFLRADVLRNVIPIAYLTTMGSAVIYPVYVWLVNASSPSVAGSNAYVTPIAALALGALVLHEAVTPLVIVSAVITLAGVIMIVSSQATPRARIRLAESAS